MMPYDPDKRAQMIKYMLDYCKNELHQLTSWEQDFIMNIYDIFSQQGTLSNGQANKLEQIYDKL